MALAGLHYFEGTEAPAFRKGLKVTEITTKSAQSIDPLPGLDYGLNGYVGCTHSCGFCYVPSLLHRPMEEWGTFVMVKRNAATVLAQEVKRLPKGLVAISTATDPYQYMETRYCVTRYCLQVLSKVDWPVSILTRSPLVMRDKDLLKSLSSVKVGMSVPTLDDEARRLLEPYAPSIRARLGALRELANEGFETFVSYAPVYPPTGGWTPTSIADELADAGVGSVSMRGLDLRAGMRSVMLRRIQGSELGERLREMVDTNSIGRFIDELCRALILRGVGAPCRGKDFGKGT